MADSNDLEKRIQRIEEHLGIQSKRRYKFEELMDGLDRRTLEMIWTGVDTYNIAVSLIGLADGQLKKAKKTFSKARWVEITNEYHGPFMREITESSISVNRGVILEKIHRLERMGEIVVGRDPEGEYVLGEILTAKTEPFVNVESWFESIFSKV